MSKRPTKPEMVRLLSNTLERCLQNNPGARLVDVHPNRILYKVEYMRGTGMYSIRLRREKERVYTLNQTITETMIMGVRNKQILYRIVDDIVQKFLLDSGGC